MPRSEQWKALWAKKLQKIENVTITGCCYIQRSQTGGRIQVTIPKPNEDAFILEAVKMNGRKRPRSNMWSFAFNDWAAVLRLCHSLYGENKTVVKGRINEVEDSLLQPYYSNDSPDSIPTAQCDKEGANGA